MAWTTSSLSPSRMAAGDFKGKRGVAAAMLAEELAIQPDAGGVIHRAEVQQEPLAAQCRRNLEMPPIPDMRHVVRRQTKAREFALRAEGHHDSLREVTAGNPAALLALALESTSNCHSPFRFSHDSRWKSGRGCSGRGRSAWQGKLSDVTKRAVAAPTMLRILMTLVTAFSNRYSDQTVLL